MLRHNFLCNGTYLCFSICQDMHPCPSPEPPESCSSAAPPRLTVPFLHLHIAALSRLLSLIFGSSHPFMRLSNLPWQPKLPIVSSSLAGWCRAPDWGRRAPLPPDSSTEQLQIHRTVRSLPVSGGSSNTVELHHTRHLTKASSQPKNPCPALRRVLAICKNDNVQLLSIESFAVACTKQLGMPAKGHKHWVIYIAHDLVQCETSPKHAARHPVPAEPAALFGCCTYMAGQMITAHLVKGGGPAGGGGVGSHRVPAQRVLWSTHVHMLGTCLFRLLAWKTWQLQGCFSGQVVVMQIILLAETLYRLFSWRVGSMPAAHDTRPAAGNTEGSRPAGTHPADSRPVVVQDSLPGILPTHKCAVSCMNAC